MADDQILTDLVVPIDMSQTEEWIPSNRYELGEHEFVLLGAKQPAGPKLKIVAVHKIVGGPKEDIGRQFNIFFTLDNQKAWGPLKAYMNRIGGEKAWVRGQPYFGPGVVGVKFKANITSRVYKNKQDQSVTQFELDMSTIKITAAAVPNAATSAVPT